MFVEERHERGESETGMEREVGPQPPNRIRLHSPWRTVLRTLAHREEAGSRAAERKGREGAGLSAGLLSPWRSRAEGGSARALPALPALPQAGRSMGRAQVMRGFA